MAKKKSGKKKGALRDLGSFKVGPAHQNRLVVSGMTSVPDSSVTVAVETGTYQVFGDYDGDTLVALVVPIKK
jgi:hypothetical protein